MSSVRGKSNQMGPSLPPTFGKDDLGHYISVVCGSFTGQLYVDRMNLSKRAVGKCVLCSGKWYTPSEFETLGGKKAKKWRQSLMHLGKRLCEYDLSISSTNILLPSSVLSCNEASQQHITADLTSVGAAVVTSVSAVGTSSTAQADKPTDSSLCLSDVSVVHNSPFLVDPVLSFIKAFRLKGDNETLKGIVIERFSNAAVESAKALLWGSCENCLLSAGLVFHTRRHSDKRSQLVANLDDLLQAFQCLDSLDQVPPIYCEAFDLLKLPPLALDPIAEQVKSNSLILISLTSTIENLSQKLTSLGSLQQPVAANSFASVVSSGGQPPLSCSSTSLHVNHRKVGAGLPSQNNTSSRELNLVLFGLQETSSIVETKEYVDEILNFIAGRPISIKDLFRLGRLARPSSPSASISRRPRPVLIKLLTAWDRKVVLFSKRKLKDFRLQRLFLREDLSPDHKVRQWRSGSKPAHESQSAPAGAPTSKPSQSRESLNTLDSVSLPISQQVSPSESSSPFIQTAHHSGVEDSASLPTSLLPSASMADITSFQQLAGGSHSPSNSISLTDRDTPLAAHGT